MTERELKEYLQRSLGEKAGTQRREETIHMCLEIMRERQIYQREQRTGFFQYLSDIFRFESASIFGLQAAVLLAVCMALSVKDHMSLYIPAFMPLFVLAVMPALFRAQYYGMGEMEAATRASGAQIALAKLVLAGAADLVCMTVLISLERNEEPSAGNMVQLILYCLVPYLVCMTVMLRVIRLRRRAHIPVCVGMALGSCLAWGLSARALPGLYEASATGLWGSMFVVFSIFFGREIYYIIAMRKEGKLYGVIG